jgi:uncharacterized protein YijF (DUF1287 family)
MQPARTMLPALCAASLLIRAAGAAPQTGTRIACSGAVRRTIVAARDEVGRGVRYDASYRVLAYPGGDPPKDRGACTDVLIRAFRANKIDLQQRTSLCIPSATASPARNRASTTEGFRICASTSPGMVKR